MKRFVEGTDRQQSTLFPAVLDEYVAGLALEDAVVLGAVDERGELVGLAELGRPNQKRECELAVSVLRSARRTGIGTRLLQGSLLLARQRGVRRLLLHCLADNQPLIDLARQQGARFEFAAGEAVGAIELAPRAGACDELTELESAPPLGHRLSCRI